MALFTLLWSFSSKRLPSATLPRPYKIHVGASFSGKNRSAVSKPFPAGSVIGEWRDKILNFPKAVKSQDCGQDFFFLQSMRSYSGMALGVADGVGGWVDSGVDPALFSQALMFHSHRYARNAWAGEPEIDPTLEYEEREQIEGWELTPYECLDLAYGGVLREKLVQAGSSTACLITINASSGVLRSASLGDSGFMIIRSNSIFYRQRPQTHFFNCPKQLTKLPTNDSRGALVDLPDAAETFRTKLGDGDIVIAFTDGLSDNVFSSEVVTLCTLVARRGGAEDEQVQAIADTLVDYARQCMSKKNRVSPFEREAAQQGLFFRGGKPDDVTVVVGLVRETL